MIRLRSIALVLLVCAGCRSSAPLAPSASRGQMQAQPRGFTELSQSSTEASQSSTEGTRASEASSKASAESSAASNQSSKPSTEASQPSTEATRASEPSSRASRDSSAASEQSSGTGNGAGLLASTATLGVTVGGIGLTIWLVNRDDRPRAAEAARAWLRSQEHQLMQDLALGAGPGIVDLAAAAEIAPENLTRFGRLLRSNRSELLARLPAATRSPERAQALLSRIGELARRDDELQRDYRRFLASRQLVD